MTMMIFTLLLLLPALAFWAAMVNAYMVHSTGGDAFKYLKGLAKFAFEHEQHIQGKQDDQ